MADSNKTIKIDVKNNFKQTEQDASGMNAKLKETTKVSKGLGASIKGATSSLFNMQNLMTGFAVGAIVGGISAVTGAFSSLVSTFSGFSQSLSGLQAILGASSSDMEVLSDQAKQLGASTQFTAQEVVGLQTELAKLGFTTKEIQASTEATLNLASSLDVGLSEAAMLAGSTLRAFGLDASETSRVVDVMAKSSSQSALDFSGLQESLKLVAPTSRALGVSLEETTAFLGVLADNGLKGSIAGTGLSKSFIQLTKAGIPLNEALEKVRNSSNQLNTAVELVGVVGAKSLLTLANNAPRIDKLKTSLDGAEGSAKNLSETRLDNLAGDTTKLGSAWEGFLLSIEDGEGMFNGLLRGIVQATTALLNFLTPTKEISEAMEDERTELFLLESELNRTNTTQERRTEIITTLQDKYPDYLGNLDAETVSNEELSKAINEVNKSLVNKIILQEKEEEILEQAEETASAVKDRIEEENLALDDMARIRKKLSDEGRTFAKVQGTITEQTTGLINELQKEFNKNVELRQQGKKTLSDNRLIGRSIDNLRLRRRKLFKVNRIVNEEEAKGNALYSEKDAIMQRLGISTEKASEGSEDLADGLDGEAEALEGVIELKKKEIEVAQEAVNTSDLKTLPAKNRELKQLQEELKALQSLGVEKSKGKKLTQDQIDARLALEERANELSIDFDKKTSNTKLKNLIKAEEKRRDELIKSAEQEYNDRVRANQKRIDQEDAQFLLIANRIKDEAEREKALLQISYNEKFAIAEGNAELEKQLAQDLADELVAIDKKKNDKELENKKKLEAQKVSMASDGFGALADLVSAFEAKDEESAKRQFNVNKALQIGQTITATASGIMQQLAVPQDALTGLNFVKAGIVGATGAASLVKIASAKFEGATTGGSGDVPSVASGGSSAPNINVVGNSGINQIAQLQQEPVQAYVLSGAVTSAQALDRNREFNATI